MRSSCGLEHNFYTVGVVSSTLTASTKFKCPFAVIGSQAGLRSQCRKACEFESHRGYKNSFIAQLVQSATLTELRPQVRILLRLQKKQMVAHAWTEDNSRNLCSLLWRIQI